MNCHICTTDLKTSGCRHYNKDYDAIDKLRNMVNWFNMQSEYFAQQFKTVSQLEAIFDFASKHEYEFLDNDYIYAELTEEERAEAISFIDKVMQ